MPIKYQVNRLRRIQIKRIGVGALLVWLLLTLMACNSVDGISSSSTPTLAPPQESTSAIVVASLSAPTSVNSQPLTLTTIPTKILEAKQIPAAKTAVPMVSPARLLPTPDPTSNALQVTPAAIVSPTLSPATSPAFEPPAISATSSMTPTLTAAATDETVHYTVGNIGHSSRGFPLTTYQFKDGPRHIIIVGGIHGGYEWNTILLAYELIDYFQDHPAAVPDGVTLTFIPAANPDGQEVVTGKTGPFTMADVAQDSIPGRFNGNGVDLNRNWDCQWAPEALWRGHVVSGGEAAFSEPETIFLRDFILQHQPDAVIFLHSAANGVFASGCPNTDQPSMDLARIYGEAAGYTAYERFSAYEVTGDAGDWLTTQGITSISIELKNHENLDLERNLGGMLAVLKQYE